MDINFPNKRSFMSAKIIKSSSSSSSCFHNSSYFSDQLSLSFPCCCVASRKVSSVTKVPSYSTIPATTSAEPSSLLDVNYFQTSDLYIFSLGLFIQFYCCYYLLFLCAFQLCYMLYLRQLPFPSIVLFNFLVFQEYDCFQGLLGKLNQILFSWWKIPQRNKNSIFGLKKKISGTCRSTPLPHHFSSLFWQLKSWCL